MLARKGLLSKHFFLSARPFATKGAAAVRDVEQYPDFRPFLLAEPEFGAKALVLEVR